MNTKRTILVTGGAGFIGSTLLNLLVPKYPQYDFINVDALTSVADLNNIEIADADNYSFIKTDIRDHEGLKVIFTEHNPTDIIHLAAESHVDVSIENPQLFVETNVLGTANLLTLALEHSIDRFLHVSTDEVYGTLTTKEAPWTETSPLLPNSPYSASKASSDCLVRSFHQTYGLNVVISRCSNNYGPRQDLTKFIPNAINKILAGDDIPVYGNGSNIRDWLYVDDHVTALDLLFHEGVAGEVYNVGGGTEESNLMIAKTIAELASRPEAITFVADRKGHDFRYALTGSKLAELGWTPKKDLKTGLRDIFAWYREKLQ